MFFSNGTFKLWFYVSFLLDTVSSLKPFTKLRTLESNCRRKKNNISIAFKTSITHCTSKRKGSLHVDAEKSQNGHICMLCWPLIVGKQVLSLSRLWLKKKISGWNVILKNVLNIMDILVRLVHTDGLLVFCFKEMQSG